LLPAGYACRDELLSADGRKCPSTTCLLDPEKTHPRLTLDPRAKTPRTSPQPRM
jgi:hypothetical protein